MSGHAVSVVLVMAPTPEAAESLVRTLVAEELAACGNIVPGAISIYRWQGEVQRDAEVLVLLKTAAARVEPLIERVLQLHPYEVPEVIELPVTRGSAGYLAWVAANTGG